MTGEYYKEKYQQLQLGGSESLEEHQKSTKVDTANNEEKEAEEKLKKEKEAAFFHWQKEEEAKKELVKYDENQEAVQENNGEPQEKNGEVHQSQEEVDHWVINKDEVTLTEEELGRGAYAVVTVGIFRGKKVAVKSLHTILISDYNQGLFSREMSIASRVRHPNLVQFIGATKVGNPLILTELMSTNLNQELRRNRLNNQQILSIAQDVALGLNYLHLFKPQPIIHRDVSSPNVLLRPCTGAAGYEAKVADYGTAKVVQAESTSKGTEMPGNVAYAAPEARDPDRHSPAMDVYSYSVLLMEMNLCHPPEMTIPLRKKQAGNVLWPDMKSLIQRGLNSNPRDRPTMAKVIESLKKMKI